MTSGKKQSSSVNPDLRLNRIKSSFKSNPDNPAQVTSAQFGQTVPLLKLKISES